MKLLRHSMMGFAVTLALAASARAQVIIGTVVDNVSGQPIRTAEILVIQGDSLKTVLTDDKGRFTMYIAPGLFRVRASALGYGVVTGDALAIERLQRVVMNVVLSVDPVEITPINVVSRRPQLRLGREGFQWRKERAARSGMGRILDAGDIARYKAMVISDVVRKQPFMNRSLFSTPYYSPVIRLIGRQSAGGDAAAYGSRGPTSFSSVPYGSNVSPFSPCAADGFRYYINGAAAPAPTSMEMINVMFSPSELVGLEIYRPHEAPGEFGGGLNGCGAIVIWTR